MIKFEQELENNVQVHFHRTPGTAFQEKYGNQKQFIPFVYL